jgi:hypothetical protein
MTQNEWEQLVALRAEMNGNLMALDAATQERYTELLVKSLAGKGDVPARAGNRPVSLRKRTNGTL